MQAYVNTIAKNYASEFLKFFEDRIPRLYRHKTHVACPNMLLQKLCGNVPEVRLDEFVDRM